ncbi:MAG: hypothetical protein HQL37_05970 [Alphaproteobacteria bacterium]|nr:hypothetical protein [Alphaproteobacteria bacterium]
MTQVAATILMAAQNRLLPFRIPFGFFLGASVFQGVMWGLLALAADQVAGFQGGVGPMLAVLHSLTLGVLVMAAIGATLQILPVVTGQALRSVRAAGLIAWLYVPGVPVLLYGFYGGHGVAMRTGGGMVAGGLALFVGLVGDVLGRTHKIFPVLRAYCWAALIAATGVAILGLLAIADLNMGFLTNHSAVGLAHFILAAFGFMGCLVFGYSHILVPMFALAPAPGTTVSTIGFILTVTAVITGVAGGLTGVPAALGAAIVLGLGAVAIYLKSMPTTVASGMRKNLGLSFVLVKAAWVMLPVALATGGAALLRIGGERGLTLFVFLTLFGWLLTFLLGVLQRVIPFLAAMNASGGGGMPRLSSLGGERPLKIHAVCHAIALVAVMAGILTRMWIPILAGSLVGMVGAAFFLWFTITVFRRLTHTLNTQKEKKSHAST